MTIPLATTTITVRRPASDVDPYESESLTTITTGVRARIGMPSGSDRRAGGDQEIVDAVLWCDTTDLQHQDVITDDQTGDHYEVRWIRTLNGLGLDHVKAGLIAVKGASIG